MSAEDLLDYALSSGAFKVVAAFGFGSAQDTMVHGQLAQQLPQQQSRA